MAARSLDEFVHEDNAVRVIDVFVDSLDLHALKFKYAKLSATGRSPYHPAAMLKLYIYGYLNRVRSSRRLQAETRRNMEVMWLLCMLRPDDKTICNFRSDNAKALKEVFRMFNKLCVKLELIGGETAAFDGTKVKANNGRKNCHTEKSTKETLERLNKRIEGYLKELDENDNKDAEASKTQETLEQLTGRKAEAEEILRQIEENGGEAVCTADPEAKLMKQGNGNGYDVCYNVQTAVDEKHGLVMAFEVTDSCNDLGELSSMAAQTKEIAEAEEMNALADTGYYNGEEVHKCEEAGIHCHIPAPKPSHTPPDPEFCRENFIYDPENDCVTCPAGNELPYVRTRERNDFRVYANREACKHCPMKAKCTKSKTLREIERSPYEQDLAQANARAKENPELFQRRMELSEHPFGVIKSVWGYGQFLCRGIEKTSGEAALAFLAFNLRRAINIMGINNLSDSISRAFSCALCSF